MPQPPFPQPGRGTAFNPATRFDWIQVEYDPDSPWDEEAPRIKTQFFKDDAKTLISFNQSPDIPFRAGINLYRGCEHGCIYCYARPYHEYIGLSSGLEFESKIFVKTNAPQLLIKELSSKKWKPQVIGMSGITDIYQPAEKKFRLTRACLKILAEFRNPVGMVTKNYLITRDLDLLQELARYDCISVVISITSLNNSLKKVLEPRTSPPHLRLKAVKELSQAGIPVGVNLAPVIPGLNDHEIPSIIQAAAEAGAYFVGHTIVRLPYAVKDLFEQWLGEHFPTQKEKILNRIRDLRKGKLNDPDFKDRMRGLGEYADHIHQLFEIYNKKYGLPKIHPKLTTRNFRKAYGQLTLF